MPAVPVPRPISLSAMISGTPVSRMTESASTTPRPASGERRLCRSMVLPSAKAKKGIINCAAGGEKLSELGIEIAEREADQERKHGADKDLRLEMRRPGRAEDDHAHQRSGLDRGQHESAGFLLRAVGLHQRCVETAVRHIDGADDGEDRKAGEEAALNTLRRNELGRDENDRPGGEELGQHERAGLAQDGPGRAELDGRSHAEEPHGQDRYDAGHDPLGEALEISRSIRSKGLAKRAEQQRRQHQAARKSVDGLLDSHPGVSSPFIPAGLSLRRADQLGDPVKRQRVALRSAADDHP